MVRDFFWFWYVSWSYQQGQRYKLITGGIPACYRFMKACAADRRDHKLHGPVELDRRFPAR